MTSTRRWFAMGDPQAPFERVLGILRDHGLLDGERLKDEVGLVSLGDHFDFPERDHGRTLGEASQDGTDTLRWLSEHPRDQVVVLIGNHDAARVMELAFESDASFLEARRVARETPALFHGAFPRIPTADIASRDYSSFAEHQRALVQRLLLEGRMQLAVVGRRDDAPVLLTHAGVTRRQVEQLGCDVDASAIAAALELHLRLAVGRVRPAWERSELAALDLQPIHVAGASGREGGGLLYHRPSMKEDDAWGFDASTPRRFHPRDLPRGLVQLCGHTGHHKCRKELAAILSDEGSRRERGGLRTLAVGESGIRYAMGIDAPGAGEATMYLADIEMAQRSVTELPLFPLDDVVIGAG